MSGNDDERDRDAEHRDTKFLMERPSVEVHNEAPVEPNLLISRRVSVRCTSFTAATHLNRLRVGLDADVWFIEALDDSAGFVKTLSLSCRTRHSKEATGKPRIFYWMLSSGTRWAPNCRELVSEHRATTSYLHPEIRTSRYSGILPGIIKRHLLLSGGPWTIILALGFATVGPLVNYSALTFSFCGLVGAHPPLFGPVGHGLGNLKQSYGTLALFLFTAAHGHVFNTSYSGTSHSLRVHGDLRGRVHHCTFLHSSFAMLRSALEMREQAPCKRGV